ncbi:hypothetical protein BDAP_002544 [Binucleata daphniae]
MTENMDNESFNKKTKAKIEQYWLRAFDEAKIDGMQSKDINLPLARIKRLMKVEEEVKMVANDVPILFSKVTEKFVEELTLRAWYNTEHNRRRILQRNDISAAAKTSDVFDFLIYVVPKAKFENATTYENLKFDEHGKINFEQTKNTNNNK